MSCRTTKKTKTKKNPKHLLTNYRGKANNLWGIDHEKYTEVASRMHNELSFKKTMAILSHDQESYFILGFILNRATVLGNEFYFCPNYTGMR